MNFMKKREISDVFQANFLEILGRTTVNFFTVLEKNCDAHKSAAQYAQKKWLCA